MRLIAFGAAIVALLGLAATQIAAVAELDLAAVREVHERTAGWLTEVVFVISHFGSTPIAIGFTAGAVATLALSRHWHAALALALSVGLTQVVVTAVKLLVSRPRPDEDLSMSDPSGASFPSAHSATAVAAYLMLALVATKAMPDRFRKPVLVCAVLIVLAIGASRIYLGAHYPTDVLAGWLTGGALVLFSWAFALRLPGARTSSLAA
jgi:undecaprenyl-diphosphatase